MKITPLLTFTVACITLGGLKTVHAAILVEDTFDRGSDGNLAGDSPTTDNIGGLNWEGRYDTAVTDSGKLIMTPGTGTNINRTFYLDLGATYFSENPDVYSLSFDVSLSGGAPDSSDNWLGFGFVSAPNVSINMSSPDERGGQPWMQLNQAGDVEVFLGRGGINSVFSGSGYPSGQTYKLELVLDTTSPNWSVAAFVNDTQLDLNAGDPGSMVATYGTNPTGLTSIAISPYGDGTVTITGDNFALSNIPEPTTYALLLGVGALVGTCLRRRRG